MWQHCQGLHEKVSWRYDVNQLIAPLHECPNEQGHIFSISSPFIWAFLVSESWKTRRTQRQQSLGFENQGDPCRKIMPEIVRWQKIVLALLSKPHSCHPGKSPLFIADMRNTPGTPLRLIFVVPSGVFVTCPVTGQVLAFGDYVGGSLIMAALLCNELWENLPQSPSELKFLEYLDPAKVAMAPDLGSP